MWFSLLLPITMQGRNHHPHWSRKETEAKGSSEPCSGSHQFLTTSGRQRQAWAQVQLWPEKVIWTRATPVSDLTGTLLEGVLSGHLGLLEVCFIGFPMPHNPIMSFLVFVYAHMSHIYTIDCLQFLGEGQPTVGAVETPSWPGAVVTAIVVSVTVLNLQWVFGLF